MKTIATHQPNYIPWLGYFYKVYQSDVFVFLDDIQFSNSGNHASHYIKTPQGVFRLKIPVEKHYTSLINEVTLRDDLKWRDKHLKTIENNYKKANYFPEIFSDFSRLLSNKENNFSLLMISIVEFISMKFGFNTDFIKSSELKLSSGKENRILDICTALNATEYYSGSGAKAYQDENNFLKIGVKLKYSSFTPVPYNQMWGLFEQNVSIIDYLMNYGYNWEFIINSQNEIMKFKD